MCKKKREKKKIKLLSFLFWQHAPFSFLFLTPGSPTPKVEQPPPPCPFLLGRMSGRQSQGGGRHTGGQRPRETRVGGRERGHTGRQTDRALSPERAPPVQQGWGGGAPAGRQLRSRGHQEGMVGGGGTPWSPPALPAALVLEPGAQEGIQCHPQPGSTTEKTRRMPSPSVLALKRVQLRFPKPSEPHPHLEANTERGWQVGHRTMERQTGGARGLQEPHRGDEAEREEAGLGATSQTGRTAGGATDTLPRSPGGKPEAQSLCPAPPWGPRSWELPSPQLGWAGGQHLGRKGARVKLCSAARQIQR